MSDPLPTAVFLSGGGRTLDNLIRRQQTGDLPTEIRLVISSRGSARGVEIARQAGLPTRVIRPADHPDPRDYSEAMFDPCRRAGARLVVMAGFLRHVLIPPDFQDRVLNIHPSLLPRFGGAGMYGNHVHDAVIRAGETESGCTVHLVDNEYDHGPVLHQRRCPVAPDDTPETLAARVFRLECEALPEAIRNFVAVADAAPDGAADQA